MGALKHATDDSREAVHGTELSVRESEPPVQGAQAPSPGSPASASSRLCGRPGRGGGRGGGGRRGGGRERGSHMPSRASASAPFAKARARWRAPSASPGRAKASDTGLACPLTKGSRHCTRASRPQAAVTSAGQDNVRSGSTIATSGTMKGDRMETFWGPHFSTAFFVTSAPTPAVVGTAMKGALGRVRGRPRPTSSRNSTGSTGRPGGQLERRAAAAFPVSRALPPPTAMTPTAPASRAASVAARAVSTDGSPVTWNASDETPTSASPVRRPPDTRSVRPATTSTAGGRPSPPRPASSSAVSPPTRPAAPRPNTTRGALKSNAPGRPKLGPVAPAGAIFPPPSPKSSLSFSRTEDVNLAN